MELPQSPDIKQYARLGFEAVLVVAVAIMWWDHRPKPTPTHAPVAATPNKVLASTPTTTIQPKAVVVYVPAAKKRVQLPEEVQNDPNAFVIGSSSLGESDRPQTVTTTIDANTGQSQTFVVQDSYPWLAAENHKVVSVSYGIKGYSASAGGGTAWIWRTTFKDDLVQIKSLHLGAQISADSDASYYVGVSATYKF